MPLRPARKSYSGNVFINCPFDDDYRPIFRALVFTVTSCGFIPRCTLEHDDASQVRIEKIYRLIAASHYSIHDISRTELDSEHGLPRFNMPLELGVFLGAKRFGRPPHSRKRCLILDRERYRFQKFVSDIAGQDIKAHHNDSAQVITAVRDWLHAAVKSRPLPSGVHFTKDYARFTMELPSLCDDARLSPDSLTFLDFYQLVLDWLESGR